MSMQWLPTYKPQEKKYQIFEQMLLRVNEIIIQLTITFFNWELKLKLIQLIIDHADISISNNVFQVMRNLNLFKRSYLIPFHG